MLRQKRSILILTFTFFLLLITSCQNQSLTTNSETTLPMPSPTPSPIPISTSSANPVDMFQLIALQGRLFLVPAPGQVNPDMNCWMIADDEKSFEKAQWSLSQIDSVAGRLPFSDEDITYNVYQLKIGDWTGYNMRFEGQSLDEVNMLVVDEMISDILYMAPRCKDYAIMPIFDDLYAIDSDGNLKMISQRQVGPYDYESIDKQGVGDLYPWVWADSPVCSPYANTVYYRTSRDGQFYSIWEIDLDQKNERRFSQDVALQLIGNGNSQIIVAMDPDRSDAFVKLISTADPKVFSAVDDLEWQSMAGWIYRNDQTKITLKGLNRQIEVDVGAVLQPLVLKEREIWLASRISLNETYYLRIDLVNQRYSSITVSSKNDLANWHQLLTDLDQGERPLDQVASDGISIVIS